MITAPRRWYAYCTDSDEIYRRSFSIIRAEADLAALPAEAQPVAVRMIHASGDVALPELLAISDRLVPAARAALDDGAPIFTDSQMLAAGITRSRLPADNAIRCLLRDARVPGLAARWGTTRAAAAVSLWGPDLAGAVVAIGNAPTALFHLLELIHDGGPQPASIIGMPVGFVGSTESKEALAANPWHIPYAIVRGRRGGSAMAASAVNALAQEAEIG
jgi:precorrin-8X/cobalt-precorrin-8 methylmutase